MELSSTLEVGVGVASAAMFVGSILAVPWLVRRLPPDYFVRPQPPRPLAVTILRNALAVVQSIVRLTRAESKEAYIAAVEGRITALSRAHVLLSQSRWQGANLRRILDEELAPYRRGEVEKIG